MLVLNRWPQFRNSERWDNSLARYDDLLDAERYRVSYLCDPPGRRDLLADERRAHGIAVVPDFDDVPGVLDAAGELARAEGPFDHVVAFSEYLLDVAAAVRERYDIPGPRPRDVDRFRDKVVMKRTLAAAGIRVPRWFECTTKRRLHAAAEALGFPLVMKPVRGASSKGVRIVTGIEELDALDPAQLRDLELEEYIDGDLLHADGVVDGAGRPLFLAVSRYIAPCLDFEAGLPLGSIVQTGSAAREACERYALRVLAALDLRASAFHLEFFRRGEELVFLEIGARVPGADVSYVVDDVYGVNLFRLWVEAALEGRTEPVETVHARSGGWLTIPRPRPLPCRVVGANSLLGRVPLVYREAIPRIGDVLDETRGYATAQGGRFLFRGEDESAVARAVATAAEQYHLTTAALPCANEVSR